MKESKEVQCLICNKICKNLNSLAQHIRFAHHLKISEYKKIYLKIEEPKKKFECKICNFKSKNLAGISSHVKQKHKLSIQYYYDKYYLKDISKKYCKICKVKENTFYSLKDKYSTYCSIYCRNKDHELNMKVGRSISKTKKENPDIVERQIKNFKKTILENPEIIENRVKTRIKNNKANPEREKERLRKCHKTLSERKNWFGGIDKIRKRSKNPEIIKRRIKSYQKTLKNDPSINIKRVNKIILWRKNNPKLASQSALKGVKTRNKNKERWLNNLSKSKRESYNKLYDKNCKIPYFLYIIHYEEGNIIKIGKSKNIKNRIDKIIKSIGNCQLIYDLKSTYDNISKLEIYLQKHFDNFNKIQPQGVEGRTEWFCESILDEAIIIANKFKNNKLNIEFESFFI